MKKNTAIIKIFWFRFVKVILICFLTLKLSYAATATIKVSVITTEETCDLYSQDGVNQPIIIDFKDIVAAKVDGSMYEMPIPYILECSNATSNPSLNISINGASAEFDSDLLATSEKELGLALKADGAPIKLGEKINFFYNQKPYLTLTPKVGNKRALKGGAIYASATLLVNFN